MLATSRISVIVPAYNEEYRIEECLVSIVESSIPRASIELIVVDNASTDSTATVAAQYADLVVRHEKRDPYEARNVGAYHASSQILFFIILRIKGNSAALFNRFS